MLKFSFFKKGIAYKGGWEMNIRIGQSSLRIAQFQFAFWRNSNPVWNLLW